MAFQPWKLCECCRSSVATCQGGDPPMSLCTKCYLTLQRVRAEVRRNMSIQELEAMWALDGS